MTRAIRIHEHGGPDVLRWEETDPGSPGPGQALIRQTAAGLNFIDVYHRTGLYPVPGWPAIIGNEAAGVVEAVGDGVTEVAAGDRVAYCMSLGAYTERRIIDAARLVRLPDAVGDRQAAAMMLKGCTVQYLVRRIHPVEPGDTIASTFGATLRPSTTAAAARRSSMRPLVHEPMKTLSTAMSVIRVPGTSPM